MCDTPHSQHANALITAQNQGIVLVMVAWFLACLLALCTVSRIFRRLRSSSLRSLPLSDDAIAITASLCALGSTVIISTAVESGLGKRKCLLSSEDLEQVQVQVFVSTILFALSISISKCSILLLLHKMAQNTVQRVCVVAVGVLVLLWVTAVMAGVVFQCEMPTPWEIWTGKCIPVLPFWTTATAIDIVVDTVMFLLSIYIVWSLHVDYRQKTRASLLLSFRLFLVVASIVRIYYLQQAFSPVFDPTYHYVPYAITTQAHCTLSAILSFTTMFSPLLNLLNPLLHPYPTHASKPRHSKHWSGTTIGGAPYESNDAFAAAFRPGTPIMKEPLPSIQASMSTPTSPAASRKSLVRRSSHDILLPDVLLPGKYMKAPPRPPPPTDAERPDLSIFTKRTVLREPPMVTRLGSVRDLERSSGPKWGNVGKQGAVQGLVVRNQI
ncbi:hypothetical protein ACN47E_005515 [Coniothyrium glycines]